MLRHQGIPPHCPVTLEIPPEFDATAPTTANAEATTAATEADIKLGERTAFIPMTCQERQVLDRLEAGLQAAAGLWRESPQQQDHDRLLSSALHHWRIHQSPGSAVSTSWVWEVGRWSTQYSLPFALELRRLDPAAMEDSDQLLALSTCLRNRQIELAKRLAAAGSSSSSSIDCKKKHQKQTSPRSQHGGGGGGGGSSLADELDDEPCLCQIRWGLAPDTEAAKRRQLEKLHDDRSRVPPHQPPLPHHPTTRKLQHLPHHHHHHQQQPQQPQLKGAKRPIVKTSHLREQHQQKQLASPPAAAAAAGFCDDAGYESQGCSPSGFINDLLTSSVHSARRWAD